MGCGAVRVRLPVAEARPVPAASLLGEVFDVERRLLEHVPLAPLHLHAVRRDVHREERVLGDRALHAVVEPKIDLHRILTHHEGPMHPDERILKHTVLQCEFAEVVADADRVCERAPEHGEGGSGERGAMVVVVYLVSSNPSIRTAWTRSRWCCRR